MIDDFRPVAVPLSHSLSHLGLQVHFYLVGQFGPHRAFHILPHREIARNGESLFQRLNPLDTIHPKRPQISPQVTIPNQVPQPPLESQRIGFYHTASLLGVRSAPVEKVHASPVPDALT